MKFSFLFDDSKININLLLLQLLTYICLVKEAFKGTQLQQSESQSRNNLLAQLRIIYKIIYGPPLNMGIVDKAQEWEKMGLHDISCGGRVPSCLPTRPIVSWPYPPTIQFQTHH